MSKKPVAKPWEQGLDNFHQYLEDIALTPPPEDNPNHRARVISLYSATGGVGRSSTAKNLALHISLVAQTMTAALELGGQKNARDVRILLLDGDMKSGSTAVRGQGISNASIRQLIDTLNSEEQGPKDIKALRQGMLQSSLATNLDILTSPDRPELCLDLGERDYQRTIHYLKKYYDIIIIDTASDMFDNSTKSWLRLSDHLLCLMTPDLNSLYQNSKHLRIMGRRNFSSRYRDEAKKSKPLVDINSCILLLMPFAQEEDAREAALMIPDLFPFVSKEKVAGVFEASEVVFAGNNRQEMAPLTDKDYMHSLTIITGLLFRDL